MRQIRKKWVLAFEEHLRTGEKSKATVEKYRRAVRQFALFAAGRTVDKALVLAYRERLGREYTPSGANAALAALNGFLRFVGRSDCCVRPFKVQRTAYCPEEKELTKTEYARLAEAAKGNRRLCLLLQTLCATGIRVSELRHITAEAVRRGKAVVTCKGKTRVILLPGSLQKKLSRYIRERADCRRAGVRHPHRQAAGPLQHLAGDEGAVRAGGGGAVQGVPPQPAASVRPDVLRAGKGHRQAGGSSGPQPHRHHADLHYDHRRGAPPPVGADAPDFVTTKNRCRKPVSGDTTESLFRCKTDGGNCRSLS